MKPHPALLPVLVLLSLLVVPSLAAASSETANALPAASAAPLAQPEQDSPVYWTVDPGDTLGSIAAHYGLSAAALAQANRITDPDLIHVGQRLVIPGRTTSSPAAAASVAASAPAPKARGSVFERQTYAARNAGPASPFNRTTWVAYYGRPGVPAMGILGAYDIPDLVPKLRWQANRYAAINGDDMVVKPAFYIIYAMASSWEGADGSHLVYLSDKTVNAYIERAIQEGFGVILDVQIGALDPLTAIKPAFKFLQYENVHLALDPEFATDSPGLEIGSVTAAQVNQVQYAMSNYLESIGSRNRRMLVVHQFLPSMIIGKANLYLYDYIDLALCMDGVGAPWPKISKYNLYMDETVRFTGYKLFYEWDTPLMNERQTLGIDPYPGIGYIETTPNLVMYQ